MIKIQGVSYRIHPLFIFVMVISVITGYFTELLTLFGIVLIHELGHVVAAKGFQWRVREVLLLPFGGVAKTDESGSVATYQEIVVALAGPIQNGWMIVFALLMQKTGIWGDEWAEYFIQANMMIGLFNLLPILPLDGGRIMQAVFTYMFSYHQTLKWCTYCSLCTSAVLIMGSIMRINSQGIQMNLLVIGLFLFYSNWYTQRHLSYHFLRFIVHRDSLMSRIWTKGTLAQPIVVAGHQTVMQIIQLFRKEKYHLIYVLDDHGMIRAVLPEQRVTSTFLTDKKPQIAISELI